MAYPHDFCYSGQTAPLVTSNGQRKSITDPRGTTNYSYDNQDRVTQVVQPDNSAVGYTYDAIGNRLSMTTPV